MLFQKTIYRAYFVTDVMTDLRDYLNPKTGKKSPMISDEVYGIIMKNADRLNSAIIYDRDYNYNYFGFKVIVCDFYFSKFSWKHHKELIILMISQG